MGEPKKKATSRKSPAKKKAEPVVRTVTVGNVTSTQPLTYVTNYPKVITKSTDTRIKSVNVTIVLGEG